MRVKMHIVALSTPSHVDPRKMSAFSTLVTVGLRFPNNPHPPSMYLDKAHCTFSDVIDPPDGEYDFIYI